MHLLVLLVGGNPLPNYMTAKYLLLKDRKDKGRLPVPDALLLMYSSDTKLLADGIKEVLSREMERGSGDGNIVGCEIQELQLGTEERSYSKIKEELKDKIRDVEADSVHLNYTGGTKVMAVAACDAVREVSSDGEWSVKPIFSYVMPDEFRLVLLSGELFPDSAQPDLRHFISLSIEDAFMLHNLNAPQPKCDIMVPHSSDLCGQVLALIGDREREYFFHNWHEWPKERKPGKFRNAVKESLKAEVDKMKAAGDGKVYEEDVDKWIEVRQSVLIDATEEVIGSGFASKFGLQNKDNLEAWKRCAAYFQGEWLEQHIFEHLRKLSERKPELKITEIAWNVIQPDSKGGSSVGRFEVDVVCMRGMQPFLFTCTSARQKGMIKLKGYEALYRGEEFGGSHCKIVLVSPVDRTTNRKLARDMLQFNARNNVCLLGIDDLAFDCIESNLEKIIQGEWRNEQ